MASGNSRQNQFVIAGVIIALVFLGSLVVSAFVFDDPAARAAAEQQEGK